RESSVHSRKCKSNCDSAFGFPAWKQNRAAALRQNRVARTLLSANRRSRRRTREQIRRRFAKEAAEAIRGVPAAAPPRAESTGREFRVRTPDRRARDDRPRAARPTRRLSPSAARNASLDAPGRSGLPATRYERARSIPTAEISCAPEY